MRPEDVAHLATQATLSNGETVCLRPIRPDDAPLLVDGFTRLSTESRYLRFFSPIDHLSEAQVRYFTVVDYVDHFAWVATVRRPDGAELGVGVARYIRLRDDPTAAEAAVAVTDDHHRLGIGSLLLESLAATALSNGITAFHLLVHHENHAMIAAMEEFGATRRPNDEFSIIRFVIDLPRLADDMRGTPLWSIFRYLSTGGSDAPPSFRHDA